MEFYVGDHPGMWVGPVVRDSKTNHPVAFVAGGSEKLAPLIAAAPDMLATIKQMLEEMVDFMDSDAEWEGYKTEGMKAAYRVISKAEGGT